MNLDAGSQFSVSQLVAGAVGSTLMGMLLALLLAGVLHAGLHATGAWQMSKVTERKFSWRLAVLGVGLCLMVGGWKGAIVGAASAVVTTAKDIGPKALREGLEQAVRGAGMTNVASLDVKQLREMLTKAESTPLPPLDYLEHFRPQIEEARAKLLPAVKALLDAHDKEGKLALDEAVTSLWPKVFDELAAWERRCRRAEINSGILWVAGVEVVLALVCWAMRLTQKPQDPRPPTPPKLESWQPKPS